MDKHIVVEIAREAIVEKMTGTRRIDREAMVREHPWLAEPGAAFVTLNEHHRLRGCITPTIGKITGIGYRENDAVANAKNKGAKRR